MKSNGLLRDAILSMTLYVLLIDVLGWLPTLGRPRICAEDIQLGSRTFGGRFRVAHGTLTSLASSARVSVLESIRGPEKENRFSRLRLEVDGRKRIRCNQSRSKQYICMLMVRKNFISSEDKINISDKF